MRKKLAILTLASVLMLSGCGNSNTPASTTETTGATQPIEESEATKTTEPETESTEKQAAELDFSEITVVDNEYCSIKITEIDPDNMWGYTLKANLENKSSDKTYMFSVTGAAINGVQCDPLFATEVAAEKKSNNEITFADSTLKDNGISEFTDIQLSFRVYDSNDWAADNVAEETVHVYPYGEENATTFVREPESTDNVIIDNEYVTVTVTGYRHDDIWGYTVDLFLVNKTDKEVMFSTDEVSVNGYMADPFYATTVLPEKCAFSSISWSDSTLEENDITEIEEIEFLFKAYDSENVLSDGFANETITLTP